MNTKQSAKAVIMYDIGDMSYEFRNCLYNIHTLCTMFYISLLTLSQGKVLVRPVDH